jgi:hypothetical protein
MSCKANAAGAVTWGVQYLKLQVSNDERVAIFEQSVWWRRWLEGRINGSKSAKVVMLHDFGLGSMDSKVGSSIFYHPANSSDVICVCMGNYNQADL